MIRYNMTPYRQITSPPEQTSNTRLPASPHRLSYTPPPPRLPSSPSPQPPRTSTMVKCMPPISTTCQRRERCHASRVSVSVCVRVCVCDCRRTRRRHASGVSCGGEWKAPTTLRERERERERARARERGRQRESRWQGVCAADIICARHTRTSSPAYNKAPSYPSHPNCQQERLGRPSCYGPAGPVG